MALTVTQALHAFGLLDDEGYLVPPEHPNVGSLTKRMVEMMELREQGVKLSIEAKHELRAMIMAHDYYNEALQDLEDDGSSIDDDDEEEDDDDDEEEEEEDSLDEDQESDE
jgi:hypothetical protein